MQRRLFPFLLIVCIIFTWSMPTLSFAFNDVQKERFIIIYNEEMNTKIIEDVGGTIYEEFDSISAVAASLPVHALSLLANFPQIRAIEKDNKVSISAQKMDWGIQKIHTSRAWENSYKGKGIKIAVLDTGISRTHKDLTPAGGVSFVSYTTDYDDDHGHGSHVAGIIGAKDNNIGVVGVAPEASLYGVKVLSSSGSGDESAVIKGIDWAIENGMDIINLSLATPNPSTAMKLVIEKAYAQDILVVAAVGNDLTDDGKTLPVQYPAKYSTVIAVGAIDQSNKWPSFSAVGPEVEVAAPGQLVYSTGVGNSYFTQSGTSMAAPFAAGVLALYKQANPEMSSQQLRGLVQKNVVDLGTAGRDQEFGFGLIQVDESINKSIPTAPEELTADLTYETAKKAAVTLQWKPSSDVKGVTGYKIYRNNTYIKTVEETIYKESISQSGNYVYTVKAVNESGKESAISNKANIDVVINADSYFHDVQANEWYAVEINRLAEAGYIKGYNDGTFRPALSITRAEAITFIGRVLNLNDTKRQTIFSDVTQSFYASGLIQSSYEQKIAGGYPDGTFQPNAKITRGEIAALVMRAFQISGTNSTSNRFTDVNKNYFAYQAIMNLAENKLVSGYPNNSFRPLHAASRAEFIVLLGRALNF